MAILKGNDMTVRSDSMRPLSPHQLRSDEKQEARGKPQRKLWLWGCVALLLTITAVIIILILTVFQIKDPDIKVNSVTIKQIAFANITNGDLPSGLNITLVADVSVKNPNVASIKFGNSTSTIYYGGIVVGKGRIPAAVSKSKRTLRMNVSMDVIPKKLMAVPTFTTDLISGALNMSTYTRIQGKVKLLKSIKVTVVMKLNCTVTYKISRQTAQSHCKLRH